VSMEASQRFASFLRLSRLGRRGKSFDINLLQ